MKLQRKEIGNLKEARNLKITRKNTKTDKIKGLGKDFQYLNSLQKLL